MAIISTIDQLKDTINDIMTPAAMPDGKISNLMDTAETNLFFESVEEVLNNLYVKCRELEDLNEFTESYIQNEFSKSKKAMDRAISAVDRQSDESADASRYAATADFNSASVPTDRDGSAIPVAVVANSSRLIPYSVDISKADISSCVQTSGSIPYRTLKHPADRYRTFYVEERPGSVDESAVFLFSRPQKVNYLDLSVFGCAAKSVHLVRSDDAKIELSGPSFPLQEAKGFELSLSSVSPKQATLSISINKDSYGNVEAAYTDDVLDSIFETYTRKAGENVNVYQSADQ